MWTKVLLLYPAERIADLVAGVLIIALRFGCSRSMHEGDRTVYHAKPLGRYSVLQTYTIAVGIRSVLTGRSH